MRDPLRDPEPLIRRVYAYAAYRLGDGPDAEDVTSETFERALRDRSSYDATRGQPAAWLVGIARRCIEDARVPRPTPVAELPDGAGPGELAEDAIRRLDLAAAVAALGERDRELIALRFGADLTARQIAALLDLQTNAVEVALHRALERLRVAMRAEPLQQLAAEV
jgi:RNA polymerase sigma-70 factor (ECF subfamily)